MTNRKRIYTVFCPFGGSGGGGRGFADAQVTMLGVDASFAVIGGIDFDPNACKDFELLTGVPEWEMDVEKLTVADLIARYPNAPDVVFMSPPCKGSSKLLPSAKALEPKYQRMNRLAIVWTGLMLQAWAHALPRLILFENVPHITTRAMDTVEGVRRLLRAAGYVTSDGFHDCGEIGGLAQHRRRFLMVARRPKDCPNLLYHPPKRRVRGCGEVLGDLPMPEDVAAAGPMHRMPRISWLNWIRLALIPAGGDWRDIAGVLKEGQPRRELFRRQYLQPWDQPSATIGGSGSNGPTSIADPRLPDGTALHHGTLGVIGWKSPSGVIASASRPGQGRFSVADARFATDNPNRHWNKYAVVAWSEPSKTITSKAQPGSGGISVADVRVPVAFDRGYAVLRWSQPSPTVAAGSSVGQGAYSVADVRFRGELGEAAGQWQPIDIGDPSKAPREIPLIIADDGTWHRPLTTLELAALQGLPTRINGSPLVLAGSGSTDWREAIGNMVPPPAAKAIAEQMLVTLVGADAGAFALSGGGAVWVDAPDALEPGWARLAVQ